MNHEKIQESIMYLVTGLLLICMIIIFIQVIKNNNTESELYSHHNCYRASDNYLIAGGHDV